MKLPGEERVMQLFRVILHERLARVITDDSLRRLSDAELAVFLIVYFDTEVCNGGLIQWLGNSTGEYAWDALLCLERVQANVTAAIVREAIAMFGESGPSPDGIVRDSQISKLSDEQLERLETLTDEYSDDDGREGNKLFELIQHYVDKSAATE